MRRSCRTSSINRRAYSFFALKAAASGPADMLEPSPCRTGSNQGLGFRGLGFQV